MRRLFFISLLAILISSCTTGNRSSEILISAERSTDILERIGIYENALDKGVADERIYYNLAYLYLYQEDYENAERVLDDAISLYPESFRFYSAKLYLNENLKDESGELETLYQILSFMNADEDIRNRIMSILQDRRDPRLRDFAMETLLYYPENQRALYALSSFIPYFETKAMVNLTAEDIRMYELPLSKGIFNILLHPDDHDQTILSLNHGTLQSQAE